MPSMFTVVSWLLVPLVYEVTGPRASTEKFELSIHITINQQQQNDRLNRIT